MYKYLLILCLSVNVSFASGVKLIEYIVNSAQLEKVLLKNGIMGDEAKQVQSYVASSLAALGKKGSNVSKAELLDILSKLPVTGQDADLRRALQVALDKDPLAKDFKKADLVNSINNLIYLANRHGRSTIITCSACVSDSLAKDGFKFGVETIKNSATVNLLSVLPADPNKLGGWIAPRMKKLGLGDYSKVTPDVVAPTDEKTLAIFVAVAENGTPAQKKMVDAIKKISTTNGKVDILDPKNPQKFWKVVADDMTPEEVDGWAKTLEEVAARRSASGNKLTAEEAFYAVLREKAEGDPALMKQFETLKAKRCFFI